MQAQQALTRNKQLQVEAATDGLTGLANRRHFADFSANAFARALQSASPLSLLMLDFDRFKLVNDTHGHQAGDAVLENIGRLIKSMISETDLAARYGGEEIAIVLQGASPAEALDVADKMRTAVAGRSHSVRRRKRS